MAAARPCPPARRLPSIHQAGQPEPRRLIGDRPQLDRLRRARHAAAAETDVDVDQHGDRGPRGPGRGAERLGGLGRVDGRAHGGAAGQGGQPADPPGSTTSLATSTSPAPVSTMASASPTVAQVRPEVPGVSWRRASAGVRCAFTCGRIFFGVPRHHRSAAATFASKVPMLTMSTGDGRADASISGYLPGPAARVPPSATLHRSMQRLPGPGAAGR